MGSLAKNNNSHFITRDIAHKEAVDSKNKPSSDKSTTKHIKQYEKVIGNDVSTSSYVRGYN